MRSNQRALLLLLVVAAAAGTGFWAAWEIQPRQQEVTVCAVHFSPRGGCTDEACKRLQGAKREVLVQAYSFTSKPITQALVNAYRRGVKVDVVLDKSQLSERHSTIGLLAQAGVPIEIDAAHAIAHNKVMVIDGEEVLTGSFNFTEAAEDRNAENLLVIRDNALAVQYARNWQAHRLHAKPYPPPRAQ